MICTQCGGPVRKDAQYGICKRNPTCILKNKACRESINKEKLKRQRKNWRMTNPKSTALQSARGSAKRRRLEFSITVDDIPDLPNICPVLGVALTYGTRKNHDYSPSLDRIDGKLGYVQGNIRWISTRANILRRDATASELRLVANDAERLETKK